MAKISGYPDGGVPVDADKFVVARAGANKSITWANIKTALKTYFDSLTTTFTNKRVQPRAYSAASTATLTPEIDTYDVYQLTAQAAAINIANHVTSTPTDGEKQLIHITSDATPRAITYGTNYVAKGGVALPSTTVASKTTTLLFVWFAGLGKYNLLAAGQE